MGYAGSARDAFQAAVDADPTYERAVVNLERVETRGIDLDVVADLERLGTEVLTDTRGS